MVTPNSSYDIDRANGNWENSDELSEFKEGQSKLTEYLRQQQVASEALKAHVNSQETLWSNLQPIVKIIPGMFKKSKKDVFVKVLPGIDYIEGKTEDAVEKRVKHALEKDFNFSAFYRNACEEGEEIRMTIELDGYDVTLGEELTLVLINNNMIYELCKMGWRLFW